MCPYVFRHGERCAFAAGHIGDHITAAELARLREETRAGRPARGDRRRR